MLDIIKDHTQERIIITETLVEKAIKQLNKR